MHRVFSKRNLLGALFFLVLVGEPTVGASSGLYTPGGLVVLAGLYLTFFMLMDALVATYRLNNLQIAIVTFALYSVLITGLLHGELKDYVLHPENIVITTLIRLQSSLYPLFGFYLLRRFAPRLPNAIPLRTSSLLFVGFVLLLSVSKDFGLREAAATFHTVPAPALTASALGLLAIVTTRRHPKKAPQTFHSKTFGGCAVACFLLACVPTLAAFLLLIALETIVATFFLFWKGFRQQSTI